MKLKGQSAIKTPSKILEDLYALAEGLPRSSWYTATFRDFEELVLDEGLEPADLEEALADIEWLVNSAWNDYQQVLITATERTAETVAGHRLLLEGLAGWLEAIAMCKQGRLPAEVLQAAEDANRQLMAVQVHASRVKTVASSGQNHPSGPSYASGNDPSDEGEHAHTGS